MPKRQAPEIPARQTVSVPFEFRSVREVRKDTEDGEIEVIRFEGHASVYGFEYEVHGGPPWGWIERVEEGAFDGTLGEDPDVVYLINHQGLPTARTKSGTLTLEADDDGLFTRADMDPINPRVVELASAVERGDVDEMSFAFRVTEQSWAEHPDHEGDEMSLRKILAVNLNRGDVSAVTFGASDATNVDIMRSIDRLDERELVEARAAIERRISNTKSGGTPDQTERDGMSPEVLALLHIPSNPLLERLTSHDPGADQAPAGAAGRAS